MLYCVLLFANNVGILKECSYWLKAAAIFDITNGSNDNV